MPSHQTNEPPKDPAAARKERNRIAVAASRERERQRFAQLENRHQNAQRENEILKQQIPKLKNLIKYMENAAAKKQQNALAQQQQPQSSTSASYHQPPADPQSFDHPQAAPLQQFPSAQQQYYVHPFQPQQQQQQSFPVAHQEFYPYQ